MDTIDKENDIPDTKTEKQAKPWNLNILWMMLIAMYVFLFTSIGYIAFWEQDFNNPDKFLAKYESLREKHFQVLKLYNKDSDLSDEDIEFNAFINDYMNSANNAAGDLQELATQSFNIVLGALLAFLASTSTMVFQGNSKPPDKPKE